LEQKIVEKELKQYKTSEKNTERPTYYEMTKESTKTIEKLRTSENPKITPPMHSNVLEELEKPKIIEKEPKNYKIYEKHSEKPTFYERPKEPTKTIKSIRTSETPKIEHFHERNQ
jgi:hypothetical protein